VELVINISDIGDLNFDELIDSFIRTILDILLLFVRHSENSIKDT